MHENTSLKFIKRYLLLIISIIGVIIGVIFSFTAGIEKDTPYNHLHDPLPPPFVNNIYGIGVVESSSRNISIGSFSPGVVSKVLVNENDIVKEGTTLFILDQRSATADVENKKQSILIAESELERAKIEFANLLDDLDRANKLKPGRSISNETLQDKVFSVAKAKAEINTKEAILEQAKTSLEIAEINFDKTSILSPIDGIILKVRIAPGEFITGTEQDINSPILLGKKYPLYVRVQIDENDIWRFDQSLKAIAFERGNKNINIPLVFVRIEPYVIDKRNIQGLGAELIDTRIMELIYKIEGETENLYIGQQLDIFIESNHSIKN